MAITRAQQAKQMLQDGGMLVKPGFGETRQGYRSAQAQEAQGRTGNTSGNTGGKGGDGRPNIAEITGPAVTPDMSHFGDTGDIVQADFTPYNQRPDTITSFGDNLNASRKGKKGIINTILSVLVPGYGLANLANTARQTASARKELGFVDQPDDDDDRGNGDGEQNIIPLMAQAPSIVEQEPELEPEQKDSEEEGLFRRFRAEGGIMNTDVVGGEMDFESARQMYGLGKLVKKITRSVKKVAKSPIGKAALLYTVGGGLGSMAGGQGFFSSFMSPMNQIKGMGSIFSRQGLGNIGSRIGLGTMQSYKTAGDAVAKKFVPNMLGKIATSPTGIIAGTSLIAGALTAQQEEEAQQISDETGINIDEIRANPNKYLARRFKAEGGIMRTNYAEGSEDTENLSNDANYKGWVKVYEANPEAAEMNENHSEYLQFYNRKAEGGSTEDKEPVAKKVMPLLDMEGQEKDYRETGGFVDMGRMEKADDVPARLSKNEFVFTADAVRNAGDGSVDKGAEVMYNMMKNLESGGDVSEESQGLEGARKMFQTSQRLEEVL